MVPFPRQLYIRSCLLILFSLSFASLGSAASQTDAASPAETAAAKPTRGRLVCKPCKIDFGKVHVGQSKALPVVLRNEGHVPVTIADKSKDAPWVSPAGLVLPYTLQPGKEVKFHLVYRPRDARRVNGQISYRSNALNHVLPISILAGTSSAGLLAANPARLDFGSIAVGKTVTKNQTITNVGNAAVTLQQITDSGTGFSVGNVTTPQTLAPGHSVTFTVKFAPQKSGTDTGSLIALSNASNYRLSVVESGSATAGGSVSVTPSSLAFGNVAVGSSKTKTLTLTAAGASMTINSDAISSAEYTISGLSLPLKLGAGKTVSFQATFRRRFAGGLALQGAYTYSKVLGETLSARNPTTQNPLDWRADYGPTDFDRAHVFTMNYIYVLPVLRGRHDLLGQLFGDWELTGLVSFQSGLATTVGISTGKQGLATRPNAAGVADSGPKTIAEWFNIAAFTAPAAGFFGNAGVGSIWGPGFAIWDSSLAKQFPIHERLKFKLSGEFFNGVNHTNWSGISAMLGSGTYGRVTAARDPRKIQLGARLDF